MKQSTKKIVSLIFISIFFLLLLLFKVNLFKVKEYSVILVLGVVLLISVGLMGYTKIRESNEKNIIMATGVLTFLYQAFIFVLFGFLFGFLTSGYTIGVNHLFKIVLPQVLIIILEEILRYQFLEKGRGSKLVIFLTPVFFLLVDVLMGSLIYTPENIKGIFELSAMIIFPSIMKNIYLTYSTYYYGFKPSIIYRLIMEITGFYLPIVPNISEYIECILNLIVPFLLLIYIMSYTETMILKPKHKEIKETSKGEKVFYTVSVLLMLLLVLFMSGIFKYYLLAVGSGSMEPNISVGDMVLVEKTKDYEDLKVGDVLVYKKEDKVIVHRIVEIDKSNGFLFKTKGDNNDTIDGWEISEKEVIGKVQFKIKYIGYPTVFLNRCFEGGS